VVDNELMMNAIEIMKQLRVAAGADAVMLVAKDFGEIRFGVRHGYLVRDFRFDEAGLASKNLFDTVANRLAQTPRLPLRY